MQILLGLWLLAGLMVVGCAPGEGSAETAVDAQSDEHEHEAGEGHEEDADHEHEHESQMLFLPALDAADLDGGKLRVVATTSIIGDVVAQVGGTAIDLTTLMAPGQEPHSFEPTAQALTAVAEAHVIFINGWDLEEGLLDDLANVADDVPLVAVAARIEPRELTPAADHEDEHQDEGQDGGDHEHGVPDPHTWLDPRHAQQWVANIKVVLSDLDPANAAVYDANADAYQAQLADLIAYVDEQVASIPEDGRKLVTQHDALGYFADRYHFQVVGTVLPAFSALAEPSAGDLAALVEVMEAEGVCAIFVETTANDALAQAVADELAACPSVQIVALYTGALGGAGSGADTYIDMMRANVDAIVAGLQ